MKTIFKTLSIVALFFLVTKNTSAQNTPVDLGDRVITMLETESAPAYGVDATAKEGNVMLAIHVTAKNSGTEKLSISNLDWQLKDAKGKTYYCKSKHEKAPQMKYSSMEAGATADGWLVFEVPAAYKTLGLTLTHSKVIITKHDIGVIK